MANRPPIHRVLGPWLLAAALAAGCCKSGRPPDLLDVLTAEELERAVSPSNDRHWVPAQAVLPVAQVQENLVTIRNVRHCKYLSQDDYIVRYYDRTFDLNKLQSVDFVMVPFKDTPSLAHTLLSFGFGDDGYLAVSIEARLEEGETYSPVKGALRQYELTYVLADERDVIGLRSVHRRDDVYLYPARVTPEQARVLLLDVLARANKLAVAPEFYDALANNCTTNIVDHVNRLRPGRVPLDVGTLLPGYSDRLAYELGLIDTRLPFEEAQRRARIDRVAAQDAEAPDFSQRIRQR